jgi:hypothetical protein
MIDPASSWFEVVEMLVTTDAVVIMDTNGHTGTTAHDNIKLPYFDKSSEMISTLVNKTWFSCYPHCQYIFYDNGSKFKHHFKIEHKPISVKNPQVNAILE